MGNAGSSGSKERKVGKFNEKTDDSTKDDDSRPALRQNVRATSNNYSRRKCRAANPFLVFFLRLQSKRPKEPVTILAKVAGKLWSRMNHEEKRKYVDLANAEKKRREKRKRKRRQRKLEKILERDDDD